MVKKKFGRLGIATRVLLLIAPPLVAMLGASGTILAERHANASSLGRVVQLSALVREVGELADGLQLERDATGVVLASGGRRFTAELATQRRALAEPLDRFLRQDRAAVAPAGSGLATKLASARADLMQVLSLRSRVDMLGLPPAESFARFSAAISRLLDLVPEAGATASDPLANRLFLAMFDLMQAEERASQERGLGAQGYVAGGFPPELFRSFAGLKDEQDVLFRMFGSYATPEQQRSLTEALADRRSAELDRMRRAALTGNLDASAAGGWFDAATARISQLHDVELNLSGQLAAAAQTQQTQARTAFVLLLFTMGGATALIIITSLGTGRSLARPIRRMTQAMTALAGGDNDVEIPERRRGDEIGEMAAAVEVFRTNAILRQRNEQQISHMARHDALTELPNRLLFQERIQEALARVGRGRKVAVMCLDVDNFKAVNDTYGHPAGDDLLRDVARRLQACIGQENTLARLGGDEFAVVQIELGGSNWASGLAQRLVESMAEPFQLNGHSVPVSISVGVAITQGRLGPHQLLRHADVALHHAKDDGRNTFRFFDTEMDEKQRARRQIETDMREAVSTDQFELFYQPLYNTKTREIVSFEALMRWAHPVQGRISPADFIPVAEETGLIVALGEWALGQACKEAVRWPEHVTVAVNLSPVQFKNNGVVRAVEDALRASGLKPSRLEIEVTESLMLQDNETTMNILHRLHSIGVKIALDDFGTGYSSLSYLRSFPFDKLKIDQCFVRGLGGAKDTSAIVHAIATLGRSMDMRVTAEGVETEEQLTRVQAEGCTEVQGFLFSKPMPVAEARALLGDKTVQPEKRSASGAKRPRALAAP